MTRLPRSLLVASLALLTACGGSTASYTRFRARAEQGRAPDPAEIRASDFVAYHAQADVPRPDPALAAGGSTSVGVGSSALRLDVPVGTSTTLIEAQLGNPHLPAQVASRPVLQIALRGGAARVRYPALVVVVVDVSGSMREGDKIGAVRHALARFVETLDPEDRLAIVTFSDSAYLALPTSRVGDARDAVLAAIGDLSAYGGTNLEAGLRAGLEVAYQSETFATSVTRLVLLSDGMPSVGVTDSRIIVSEVQRVDARQVPITTVGMGDEIDYALLDAIARESGGAFHYLDRPSEVERLFSTELASLTEIAARDAHLRVRLPAGWGLSMALDERTRIEGDELVTPLGDLGGDEATVVLAELLAPPASIDAPIDARITYLDPTGSIAILADVPVAVHRDGAHPYVAAPGGTVLRNAALARAAMALRNAGIQGQRGDALGHVDGLVQALASVCSARATLDAQGESSLARSLDEVVHLVASITPQRASSASFAGWHAEPGWAPVATSDACGSAR